MAKPLQTASVKAPGFYGLNTQDSSITLEAGFALKADNCVIDQYGRLGSRKGWEYVTTSGGTSTDLQGGHEFVDIDGTRTVITWGADTFYTGTATLATPIDNSTVFATSNFDASTLNDKAFFVQAGDEPRYFDPTLNAGAGGIVDISAAGNTVTNLSAIDGANTCLSAYGRLWLANTTGSKTTVYWSNLLDGTNFDSGTAGSIDLSSILVRGNDEIVALAAHAGRLIVFCKNNIVIFQDTDADTVLDPATMRLVEVIRGYGCVARDSIQNTGLDVLFLSDTGLMSLGRLIQEKSQPMRELSKNVRDELVYAIDSSDVTAIRSIYSAVDAFYLLLLPDFSEIYCFDMRQQLDDGSSRVTKWDKIQHNSLFMADSVLYFCQTDGIAQYNTYQDNGSRYTMKYFTTYFDFGDATNLKILKRLGATVIGGSGQAITLKAGFDYEDTYTPYIVQLDNNPNYEYGVAEYNIAEYSIGTPVDQLRAAMGGDGNVIQMGIEARINGDALSVQRLDIYIKQGRTY